MSGGVFLCSLSPLGRRAGAVACRAGARLAGGGAANGPARFPRGLAGRERLRGVPASGRRRLRVEDASTATRGGRVV